MRSVEKEECGKCGVWKTRSVENAECGKCGVFNSELISRVWPIIAVLGILRRLPYVHAPFVF